MKCIRLTVARTLALGAALLLTNFAAGQTYKVLHSFGGPGDGFSPNGSVIFDAEGNLYGATWDGPVSNACNGNGCGTVFELKPNGDGTWSETLLHEFHGIDGAFPAEGLVKDSYGNLYGVVGCTTTPPYCGAYDGGIFQLASQSNGSYAFSILQRFAPHGTTGYGPGWLATVPNNNIYGALEGGGTSGGGVAFVLRQSAGGSWSQVIAQNFGPYAGPQASAPYGPIAVDANGNVFGSTWYGGSNQVGTVYELSPHGPLHWIQTVLYSFAPPVQEPNGVTLGPDGSLYGTTQAGGSGHGTVFRLTPSGNGAWTYTLLYSFQGGTDGAVPFGAVTFDSAGNMYGVTVQGGYAGCEYGGCGTIYKLTHSGSQWIKSTVYSFEGGTQGYDPIDQLTLDAAGNIYGIADFGGAYGQYNGLIYEFTP